MDNGIPAALRKISKRFVAKPCVALAVSGQFPPEVLPQQVLQPRCRAKMDLGLFSSRRVPISVNDSTPGFYCVNSSGKAVPTHLYPQRRASGDHDLYRRVINQGLKLGTPIVEVLDFVKKEVCRLILTRQSVEAVGGDVSFEPIGKADNRLSNSSQRLQFIELDPENIVGRHTLIQQVSDDLKLSRCLSYLPRATNNHYGSYSGFKATANLRNQMPSHGQVEPAWEWPPTRGSYDANRLPTADSGLL